MKQVSKQEVLDNIDFYISEMTAGKIFIYPTDTLFGIGCDATNAAAVEKIFNIKQRQANKSLLFIVPSLQWIADNCTLNLSAKKEMLTKLPWPYSFIVKLKNSAALASNVSSHGDTVWMRIPSGWFNKMVAYFGKPFISTSVNISGQAAAIKISDIDEQVLQQVDYVVSSDDDVLSWKSSQLIDVTWEHPVELQRW